MLEKIWRKVALASKEAPAPRRYHTGCMYQNKLYVFGGLKGKEAAFNDLWAYSIELKSWSRIVTDPALGPDPRSAHSAVVYRDEMFVYGGLAADSRSGVALEDFWAFSFGSGKWRKIEARGPTARYHHACAIVGNSMIIAAGSTSLKTYANDVWQFNFETNAWKQLSFPNSDTQLSRAGHVMFQDLENVDLLHCFGGYTDDGGFTYLQDAFTLNLAQGTVQSFIVSGTPPYTARQIPTVLHKGLIYTFGGFDGKSPNAELMVYDMKTQTWRPIDLWMEMDMASIAKSAADNAMTKPTPRYGHSMVLSEIEGVASLLVFGGSGSMYLADLVEIDLA